MGGEAVPIGFRNQAFREALANQPKTGEGAYFAAFVIADTCPTIRKEGYMTYQAITTISSAALAETTRTDSALFDTIVVRLAAAGVTIDRKETAKAREGGPNVAAVVQLHQDANYLEYIVLEGDEFNVYTYDGEPLVELVTEEKGLNLYDPPLDATDLEGLRYLERDGVRLYEQDDILLCFEKKAAEREFQREASRTVTLTLPDEFLDLCETAETDPGTVLRGFIADLCELRTREYSTHGSDERRLAGDYFERCSWNR